MNNFRRKVWLYIVSVFIVGSFLVYQINAFLKDGSEPGAALREVVSSESLEFLWSSNLKIDGPHSGGCDDKRYSFYAQLNSEHKQMVVPVWNGKIPIFTRVYLTGFDLDTGQTNWRTQLNKINYSIGGNSSNVFVVERGPEPPLNSCSSDLHYCEAAKILAYDTQTGEEVWSTLQSNMYSADTLCVNDEIVSIVGIATRSDYQEKVSLDANTGAKIPYQSLPLTTAISNYETNRLTFEKLGIDELDIRSQYIVESKNLYFLTNHDRALWIIDKDTAEVVGKAEFSGEPFQGDRFSREYMIMTDDEYVTVYLADSQQLFLFKLHE